MSQPQTKLHYTANGVFVNNVYQPAVDGYNLADISSPSDLTLTPPNTLGLDYLGLTNGVDSAFTSAAGAFIGNSRLYGFYLVDEPASSPVTAANLMAESDWVHAHLPGAKTFIVELNTSSETTPHFYYTPANTHVDLFGLDPYPVRTDTPGYVDYGTIALAVKAAEAAGIPQRDIVPVYQAFGGGQYTSWILPTVAQAEQILKTWGAVVPNPAFDYTYSWGSQAGDTALSQVPALQQVFAAHNNPNAPTTTILPTIAASAVSAKGATVTLSGLDAGPLSVGKVEIFNGTTPLGTATLKAGGTWSFTTVLAAGTYSSLSATAFNASGKSAQGLAPFSLAISGSVVTEIFSDKSRSLSTFNILGQAYSSKEMDYNNVGQLTRILYSGYTGRPYSQSETDYLAGGVSGRKYYYTNIIGKSYTGMETAYSATGALKAVIHTGVTGAAYSKVEWDYANGALIDTIYSYDHVTSGGVYAYQVEKNAAGATLMTISDLTSGGHRIVGSADNLTLAALGDDVMTGGGKNETFLFNANFGSGLVVDFAAHDAGSGHDVISLPKAEFANFAAMFNTAVNVGANVVVTAVNGDTLTLAGLNISKLAALSADFKFHA